MRHRLWIAAVLIAAGAAWAAAQAVRPALPVDAAADEAAKFISGCACASEPWKRLQETAEWKGFVERLDKSWADLDVKRLVPMRKWAEAELAEPRTQETRTLFYPFGGPDLLTPLILFPRGGDLRPARPGIRRPPAELREGRPGQRPGLLRQPDLGPLRLLQQELFHHPQHERDASTGTRSTASCPSFAFS